MTIERIQLEGSPVWLEEHTVYVGWDGKTYETEDEALRTWGFDKALGSPYWIDASVLGEADRKMVLGNFSWNLA